MSHFTSQSSGLCFGGFGFSFAGGNRDIGFSGPQQCHTLQHLQQRIKDPCTQGCDMHVQRMLGFASMYKDA
jgi:hypothetical protein